MSIGLISEHRVCLWYLIMMQTCCPKRMVARVVLKKDIFAQTLCERLSASADFALLWVGLVML